MKGSRIAGLVILVAVLGMVLAGCDAPGDNRQADDAAFADAAFPEGAALYQRQCQACHQGDGSGLGNHFPPLAGHISRLVQRQGGREYIINVVLYGLGGPIEVQGQSYSGVMPGFGRLSDEDVAAIINHGIHAWGGDDALPQDFEPIQADEVTRQRDERLSPGQVRQRRPDRE